MDDRLEIGFEDDFFDEDIHEDVDMYEDDMSDYIHDVDTFYEEYFGTVGIIS